MDAIERYKQRRKNRLAHRMRQAGSPAEARRLAMIIYSVCYKNCINELTEDGGPGSGNHGHKGVPGQRGGSAPSDKHSESPNQEDRRCSDVLKMQTSQGASLTTWMDATEGTEHDRWYDAFSGTDYELINGSGNDSHYDPNTRRVYLEESASAFTASHETAHAIDEGAIHRTVTETVGRRTFTYEINSASMNVQELSKGTYEDDVESLASKLGVQTKNGWFDYSGTELMDAYGTFCEDVLQQYPDQEEAFSCVSDILDGVTESEIMGAYYYGGHRKSYWTQSVTGDDARFLYKEAWANFCALKLSKSTAMLGVLKECVPNLYDALEKTYQEAFG